MDGRTLKTCTAESSILYVHHPVIKWIPRMNLLLQSSSLMAGLVVVVVVSAPLEKHSLIVVCCCSLSVVLGLLLCVLIQLESIVIDLCVPCAHWAWIHQIFPSFQTQWERYMMMMMTWAREIMSCWTLLSEGHRKGNSSLEKTSYAIKTLSPLERTWKLKIFKNIKKIISQSFLLRKKKKTKKPWSDFLVIIMASWSSEPLKERGVRSAKEIEAHQGEHLAISLFLSFLSFC